MKSILIATSSFGIESREPLEALDMAGIAYSLNPYGRKLTPNETLALLKDKAGVIAGTEAYPMEVLEQLPDLKVISRCGAGTDGIDKAFLKQHNIELFSTPEVHITAVAELALAGLLALTRKIVVNHGSTVAGTWQKAMGINLSGKTVGIIGFGKVAQAFTRMLSGFGCTILFYDPYYTGTPPGNCISVSSLSELWPRADVISLHIPSTPETRGLINHSTLKAMKSGVLILNTSRGDLIDEQALVDFLQRNPEASAYLDVYQQEPYKGPLTSLPNIVLTPHIGTFTRETRVAMEVEAAMNLINFFNTHG